MLKWIIGSSLKFRFIVVAIAAGMMFFGIRQLQKMPVDVFPEFAPPRVEVQTEGPGLSTEEVEELLTIPLEERLAGTPGLVVMRSKTVPSLSSIVLFFEPGTDLMLARQLVNERLALTIPELPTVVSVPMMIQPLSATSRAMKIGLTSDEMSLIELSTIAFWKIRPRLMAVHGVANVAIWGERLEQIQVHVDPKKLQVYGISMDQVIESTADALEVGILPYATSIIPGVGGWIDTPNQRLGVQHVLPIKWPHELAKVTVQVKDGKSVLLGDLGDVVIDHPPLIGDAVINDGPGLMLVVEKFPWGNTLEVTRKVEEALDALQPGLPGIVIDTHIFRPATFIENSIDNLTMALLIGCFLVVMVLFAFLYEWRVALISLVAIPLSLVAGGLVLYAYGATINTMILAGFVIALGAVVDDAIVDIENIVRRLRQHRKEGSKIPIAKIILEASLEVRHAIIYSTLIEVIVLVPIFVMEGLSGAFFKPLALAYGVAVAASTIVALTVTPAMSFILLRNAPLEKRESPLIRWLHLGYEWVLARIVSKPHQAYITVGVIVLTGLLVMPQLGQELLPEFKERDFLMHWITKPGTSHPEMYRITVQVSKELRSVPGVRNFGAHIGRALAADEVVGINFTENWISIDPEVDYNSTLAKIQEVVEGYPGIYRDVQTYLKERIREVLTGTGEAIVVRIFGPELDVLRSKAEEVEDGLSEIDGLVDLHVALQVEVPHVQIKVNLEAAALYGLRPGDVRRIAGAWVLGTEVGDIYRDQKAYDVAVWGIHETHHSLSSLYNLMIDTPGGGRVRLDEVAEVIIAPTPNTIKHEGFYRYIDVGANVRGRDLGSVVEDVEIALAGIEFPQEYYPKLIGEYTERQAVANRMLIFAIFSLMGIFILLHTSFKSVRLAALSFLLLPTALVGGILAAYLGDGVISLGSLVGFLTVLGIAARNGILMINHFQHLERIEGETFGIGLVLRGAKERIAPIMMTATTTALALVPLVIAGNVSGNEIELPMAIVILGGLVTSTLLNVFIIPPLYLQFGGISKTQTESLQQG